MAIFNNYSDIDDFERKHCNILLRNEIISLSFIGVGKEQI